MNVQLMSTSREWSIPPPHPQRSQKLCHGEICLALRLQVGFAGAKDFECFCSFGKHPQRDFTVEKLLASNNSIYSYQYTQIFVCTKNIHILHTYQWIGPLLSNHPVGIPLASRMLCGLAEQFAQKAFPDLAQ